LNHLLVLGAGGHGVVVADAAELSGNWNRILFLDDRYPSLSLLEDWPVVGQCADLEQHLNTSGQVVVAIGNAEARISLLKEATAAGYQPVSVTHPTSSVSRLASIGAGSVVLANAVVSARAAIGVGCIVNNSATVDHDCRLSDGVHIGPGAHLAADVLVGENSWVGIGSAVRQGVAIGRNAMIAAGAAVVRDVPDGVVVAGVPARPLESSTNQLAGRSNA
jgi:sugar O-acyltransferase (sialic acid O-acetyltransferase NeuD family)